MKAKTILFPSKNVTSSQSQKLQKNTRVQGNEFINAWLDTIIRHALLWKNHAEYGDPSFSNLMDDPDAQSGALSDFDLSILQWEPRVIGTERTGTLPFMAIEILSEDYWEGKVQRWYHHELESFIWILFYVSLLYDDGDRLPNSEVNAWSTSNYVACHLNKRHFYQRNILQKQATRVQPSYTDYWPLVYKLCSEMRFAHALHDDRRLGDPSLVDGPFIASQELWKIFKDCLDLKLPMPQAEVLRPLLPRLQAQRPSFRPPDQVTRDLLHSRYSTILELDLATGRSALNGDHDTPPH